MIGFDKFVTLVFLFAIGWVCVHPEDWMWLVGMLLWEKLFLTLLAKEVAFHRYFCHKSFKTGKLGHYFLMFSTIFCPVHIIFNTATHRRHHKYSDTDEDPQQVCYTGWKNLLLFMFSTGHFVEGMKNQISSLQLPKDLMRDRNLVFLHKHSLKLFVLICILLLPISWKFVVFILLASRRVFITNAIVCGAILTHTKLPTSYRNFETNDRTWNTPLLEILHPGQGYHNNHHHQPDNWDFTVKPGEFDSGAWLIRHVFLRR